MDKICQAKGLWILIYVHTNGTLVMYITPCIVRKCLHMSGIECVHNVLQTVRVQNSVCTNKGNME